MRVHTNTLNPADIINACTDSTVSVTILSEHGSRSHARAYEVALRGTGARHTRRPNTGITGAAQDEYAATYDDWGAWLAHMFDLDPTVKAGPYSGRADFHRQTRYAFGDARLKDD